MEIERKNQITQALTAVVGEANVFPDEPMSSHTTFRVGGPADLLLTPETIPQLQQVLRLLNEAQAPYYIIGNGSNLLVNDDGYRGVLIKIGEAFAQIDVSGNTLTAGAGALLSKVARAAYEAGLAGLEFAEGIPGSLGGAVTMNAGAYGGEMKAVVTQVTVIDSQGEQKEIPGDEMAFAYRTSRIQQEALICVSAQMTLTPADKAAILAKMDENRTARTTKQPLDRPSAGSTFKRPEGYFAGKLITDAGLKGYQVGGALVSEKHAGFVVTNGSATAADVLGVIHDVQRTVQERFGVHLEPEVRMLGF